MLLTFLPLLLGGCTGGQEIESSLFVIAMAVDAGRQPDHHRQSPFRLAGERRFGGIRRPKRSRFNRKSGTNRNRLHRPECYRAELSARAGPAGRNHAAHRQSLPAAGNRHQPDAGRNGCDALHPQADSRHLPRQRRSRRRRHAGSCGRFHPQTARRARLAPVQVS